MDRGDYGFVERLQPVENLRQPGFRRRFAELADIGPGNKGASLANDDYCLAGVPCSRGDCVQDALSNRLGKRVDGRVVDRNNANIAFKTITDRG